MNALDRRNESRPHELRRELGLSGQVTVLGPAAAGVLLGGVVVALMTLGGRLSAFGLFTTATGLFVLGASLGLMHGGVLAFLGRAPDVTRSEALRDMGLGLLYAIPALAVAWLLTVWIAMTVVAANLDRIGPAVGVGLAWIAGAGLVAVTAVKGARALRHAYRRWSERRVGTVLVAVGFAALLTLFLADRPELWLIRLRVTETGAILLAAFVSLWVVGPLVTVALRLTHQIPGWTPKTTFGPGWHASVDVGVGLVAGGVLGLLAVPFATPVQAAYGGVGGAIVHALGSAVVDEVLLRLFLVTAVAWLLLRWHRIHAEEAALLSVLVAAGAQILLYLPGVVALGLPSTFATLGFTVVTVLLPALVFGLLYWARGLGTALVADATAVAAVALLI